MTGMGAGARGRPPSRRSQGARLLAEGLVRACTEASWKVVQFAIGQMSEHAGRQGAVRQGRRRRGRGGKDRGCEADQRMQRATTGRRWPTVAEPFRDSGAVAALRRCRNGGSRCGSSGRCRGRREQCLVPRAGHTALAATTLGLRCVLATPPRDYRVVRGPRLEPGRRARTYRAGGRADGEPVAAHGLELGLLRSS